MVGVGGSNPLAPTNFQPKIGIYFLTLILALVAAIIDKPSGP